MRRHRQPLHAMSEMNVTNLLDTAFILLIVFMLVAPQLSQGVKVDLPQVVDAPALEAATDKTFLITIQKIEASLDGKNEQVFAKQQPVELEELKSLVKDEQAKLKSAVRDAQAPPPELGVLVEADRDASWQAVSSVLNALAQVGITRVGFKTIPATEEDKTSPAPAAKGNTKPVGEKPAAKSAKKSGK